MTAVQKIKQSAGFAEKLQIYKQAIDADIGTYSTALQHRTLQDYGVHARLGVDTFLDILERGGKRIRGSLVLLGYEMSGGTDARMIIQAARAVEMLHAYILIIDDIQDRSILRRGGPTAHVALADYHKAHRLADNAEHFGVALALNAALSGAHEAQLLFAGLNIDDQLKLAAIRYMNEAMRITAHGQTYDIMNEVVAEVKDADIERVMEWKTAHYTFLNPLQIGMVLAGVPKVEQQWVHDYAMHAGIAFQITDDILGTFGTNFENGKNPYDDMREGKMTILVAHTLKHAQSEDKSFLLQMLGNHALTPAEFERCKSIMQQAGTLEYARNQAAQHIQAAIDGLAAASPTWPAEGIAFLEGLARYIVARQT